MPNLPDFPSPFDGLTPGDPFSDQVAPTAADQVSYMIAYTLRERVVDALQAWVREEFRPRVEAAQASGYHIVVGGALRDCAHVLRTMADRLDRDADKDDGPAGRDAV